MDVYVMNDLYYKSDIQELVNDDAYYLNELNNIRPLNIEEIIQEAEARGYTVTKKKPYVRFLPCTCGANRREEWLDGKTGGIILKCLKCGKKVRGKNREDAKRNWNEEISKHE